MSIDDIEDEYVLKFGPYEGFIIKNVPSDYLEWLLGNCDEQETYESVAKELDDRDKINGHFYT